MDSYHRPSFPKMSHVASTTRAALFHGPGTPLEIRDVPRRPLQPGETLVDIVACTLCGSDLHTAHGRRSVAVPTILGHEILGRIAAFGLETPHTDAAGKPLALGDRVTWSIAANCGDCFYCRRDLPQKCVSLVKYGHEPLESPYGLTGGLAEHALLARGTAIYRVPDSLSDETVCPANCAAATVGAAVDAAGALEGRTVLVMGAGMLGVTAAAWARHAGAAHVLCCDTAASRLDLARQFGATSVATPETLGETVTDISSGHGVDVAFELTGAPEAYEALFPAVRTGGTIVLVGSVFPARTTPLSLEQVVRRCLTIRGVHNYAPKHLQAALAMLEARRDLPFASLVAAWVSLDEAESLLHRPLPEGTLRFGVRP